MNFIKNKKKWHLSSFLNYHNEFIEYITSWSFIRFFKKKKMSLDISKYKIINKIGFGEFGEVFKVKDKETGEVYAAKVSNKSLDSFDKNYQISFKREVLIISKVHHPSILRFIGLSMTSFNGDNKPVIITDFLPNGSLEDILILSHKSCPPTQWNDTMKLICVYGIASAMSFLHENNIVHRDLKPANILLNQFLFPIIADFGLSKDEDMQISQSGIKGTPLYIAPEVWDPDNDKEIDYKKADVYAFSIILYEIYANEKPFANLTMYKLSQKICKGERPNISLIEEDPYKELIDNCWQQTPEDRPTFDQIVEVLEGDAFITDSVEEDDYRKYVSFIKNSSKSVDKKVDMIDFNTSETNVIKKVDLKKKRILSDDQYNQLQKSDQQLVDEAIDDPNKQFNVGSNLVYGKNGFTEDPKTGEEYLKDAIKGGSIEAVILYNRMLIVGKKIDGDVEKAKENLKNYEDLNNPEIIFLQAMIAKKEEKYKRSVKLLKKAIKGGCAEAMFEYGKALYLGECGLEVDKKEAKKYFEEAKNNGCNKGKKFLSHSQPEKEQTKSKSKSKSIPRISKTKSKTKFTKKIDLVILYDGTQSNKNFYDALKETFTQMANEWIDDNPTVHFRFGAIMYTDLAFSLYTNAEKKKFPFFVNLTDSVDAVQKFINKSVPKFSSIRFASDWESGYFVLLNKMNWDEDAEKIVVHMSHVPGHGRGYTMVIKLHSKYFLIPKYKKNRKENFEIYKKMQDSYRVKMSKKIADLASNNFKFYCLNGNQNSSFCFKRVSDNFIRNGGKKFVIKDLFGYSYDKDDDESIDKETLKDQFDDFFSNIIKSCVNDEDAVEFERKCNLKFKNDLNSFFKENGITYHSNDTTGTETDDDGGFNDVDDDNESKDDDDDDDEYPDYESQEEEEKKEEKKRRTEKRKTLINI